MKTLRNTAIKGLAVIATVCGMLVLGTTAINSPVGFTVIIGTFLATSVLACYLLDKNIVISRIVAVFCVTKAFIATLKPRLSESDLILIRRKNRCGGYFKLYEVSVGRYYANIR